MLSPTPALSSGLSGCSASLAAAPGMATGCAAPAGWCSGCVPDAAPSVALNCIGADAAEATAHNEHDVRTHR